MPVSPGPSAPVSILTAAAGKGPHRVNTGRVRVVVADDHEFVRVGLEALLRHHRPHWEIAGQAPDGRKAVELTETLRPDLLIFDLVQSEMNGLAVLERLARSSPGTRVMILTIHPAAHLVRTCRRLGAGAYISKTETPQNLVLAMDRILAGEPFFASHNFSAEDGSLVESASQVPSPYLLTSRELQVMRSLANGFTNKETAQALSMSVRTAESHRASIFHKLGVSSLGQLVRIAVRDSQI